MKRKLVIDNFKNLGIGKQETLFLNYAKKGSNYGDLVILIGKNNVGKSNVIKALLSITNGFGEDDKSYLSISDVKKKPNTVLKTYDNEKNKDLEISFKNSLIGNIESFVEWKFPDKEKLQNELIEIERTVNTSLTQFIQRSKYNYKYNKDQFELEYREVNFNDQVRKNPLLHLDDIFDILDKSKIVEIVDRNKLSRIEDSNHIYCSWLIYREKMLNFQNNVFSKNTGLVGIYKYEKFEIDSSQFSLSFKDFNLNKTNFLKNMFSKLNINIDEIKSAHKNYKSHQSYQFLRNIEEKINNALTMVSTDFNKIYKSNVENTYRFNIYVNADGLEFSMSRGKTSEPIVLKDQSEGFKWFFNFYFNFIVAKSLKEGDIVIFDEPATNLHPDGQIELRKMLKEFAISNNLTFVIATHSPFFIDVDYYDELRIVSLDEDNVAHIENNFHSISPMSNDTITPILSSLTIKQNVLYDVGSKVFWVEGITDYNYLTMFKKLLDVNNLCFIPFNGCSNGDKGMKHVISAIEKVKFYHSGIIVDGDEQGEKFKNIANEGTFKNRCYILKDVFKEKNIFQIEELFSEVDRNKYLLKNEKIVKSSENSSFMKRTLKKDDFDKQTLANFQKLFNYLNNIKSD